MAKANANHSNAVLLEQRLSKLDQLKDPWVIVK